jgi:hypothetical protein
MSWSAAECTNNSRRNYFPLGDKNGASPTIFTPAFTCFGSQVLSLLLAALSFTANWASNKYITIVMSLQQIKKNSVWHLHYVMLLRHQRLLTLRTWCGYRYEMVWKWITTHYFSWNNRNTHYFYLWKYFDIPSKNKRRSRKINLLFKQGMNVSLNKWNSTFIEKEKLLLTSLYCFYTEKKTLNWIPIAVIMFI